VTVDRRRASRAEHSHRERPDPATVDPPKGILKLPFSTLKAASPALAHPSKRHGIVTLTLEEFT